MGNTIRTVLFPDSTIQTYNNETIDLYGYRCADRGLILPIINEYNWPEWLRGTIYVLGLSYLFIGIAIIADIFMCSIEKITSKTQIIRYPDPNDPSKVIDREVKLWNDTVANLTLMALGSSSPEILLSVIEICGNNFLAGDLGPGTIVGSAAFNLLVITGICVVSIEGGDIRRIKNFTVFLTTTVYSVFAYIWLFLVLVVITPNEVTLWEAIITLLCFPLLVINAYMAEKNFFMSTKSSQEEIMYNLSDMSVWQRKKLFEDPNISPEEVLEFNKKIGDNSDLTDSERAKLVAHKILKTEKKSLAHYRINGVRMLSGSRKNEMELSEKLEKISRLSENEDVVTPFGDNDLQIRGMVQDLSENGTKSVIEFAASSYAVLENEQICRVIIERYGKLDQEVTFRVETIDGTAEAGEDYNKIDEVITMVKNQRFFPLDVTIIDDNQWEPDETFFVKLSLYGNSQPCVKIGHKAISMVTIIDDDEPGEIEFSQPVYVVKESVGTFEVQIDRKNGADGQVSVGFKTTEINAVANKDFMAKSGILEFKHGEITKTIPITILDDQSAEKDESFSIELFDPKGGVKMGRVGKTVVTIINDDDLKNIASRMANMVNADLNAISVVKRSWGDQFLEAMNVNGGDIDDAKPVDYVLHFFSFPWKVMFAFIPPPHFWGGWLCFFVSLACIGALTAVVGDAAAIFGCLIGLKDAVTSITFVALGTSLPDTFASKIAAQNEKTADNAIGNITGSNSVNIFLGLGLPWVFATIYWGIKGLPFTVKSGSLTFSVLIFTICSGVCFTVLFLRRYMSWFGKGELGGPTMPKYMTTGLYFTLWLIYIVLSSLQAYDYIPF